MPKISEQQWGILYQAAVMICLVWLCYLVVTALLSGATNHLEQNAVPVVPASIPPSHFIANDFQQAQASQVKLEMPTLHSWHLFGKKAARKPIAEKKPTQPKKLDAKVPETRLKLTLKGVFMAEIPEDSSAIIAQSNKDALYTVGDAIQSNVKLEAVYADQVLLSRNGRNEVLSFIKDKEKQIQQTTDRSRSSVAPSRPQKAQLTRENVQAFWQQFSAGLAKNPGQALQQLGLAMVPKNEGGGYVVTQAVPKELMSLAPINPGDRLLAVNGQPLGDPATDQSILQQALTGQRTAVEVQRGQTRFTVYLSLPGS